MFSLLPHLQPAQPKLPWSPARRGAAAPSKGHDEPPELPHMSPTLGRGDGVLRVPPRLCSAWTWCSVLAACPGAWHRLRTPGAGGPSPAAEPPQPPVTVLCAFRGVSAERPVSYAPRWVTARPPFTAVKLNSLFIKEAVSKPSLQPASGPVHAGTSRAPLPNSPRSPCPRPPAPCRQPPPAKPLTAVGMEPGLAAWQRRSADGGAVACEGPAGASTAGTGRVVLGGGGGPSPRWDAAGQTASHAVVPRPEADKGLIQIPQPDFPCCSEPSGGEDGV